jgi:hypothetical protein
VVSYGHRGHMMESTNRGIPTIKETFKCAPSL